MKRSIAYSFLLLSALACLAPLRPVRAQMIGTLPIDGIKCQSMEGAAMHIHQHLQLFNHGKPVVLPANIGISMAANCLYWLHTHQTDGIIHVESPQKRNFTLGEFFDVWGQELSWWEAGPIRATKGQKLFISVNHAKWTGKDPRAIPLRDHEEIVIQSGPPWAKVYKDVDWSKM